MDMVLDLHMLTLTTCSLTPDNHKEGTTVEVGLEGVQDGAEYDQHF